MERYDHTKIEKKWQERWKESQLYTTSKDTSKPKSYVLDMFPYPSGEGLHVGHPKGYIATDIYSRMKRMQGHNVLHPMGWDAFGLPAENFAIKNKIHPRVAVEKNIATFKDQLSHIGFNYDWSREINTTDPAYYKWTQWIFLQLFKKGLAYQSNEPINWCPSCMTGLANEDLDGNVCERCGSVVEKRALPQWVLKITAYADRMLTDLDALDWPEHIKTAQRNWIGKSEGSEIDFELSFASQNIPKPNYVLLHGFTGRNDKNFIPWVKAELEKRGFEVQAPLMPNTDSPTEEEQVSYVIENCRIDENTVLLGHSLGSAVAMKVLQKLNRPIAGLVLVASVVEPVFRTGTPRAFWDTFTFEYDYEKIKHLTKFRVVISDILEKEKRGPYLSYLKDKIDAQFVEGTAQDEHVTGDKEPMVLNALLPHVTVFTTRADTLFGATFLVLAPEHPWVRLATDANHNVLENTEEVKAYVAAATAKTEIERTNADKEKTGVELKGVKAINPVSKEEIPLFVADYVLGEYGTGAIMAVPAHDERDFAFAKKYNIPVTQVVAPVYTLNGPSTPQKDKELVERNVVSVILYNPKNKKYLLLSWLPQKNLTGFPGGGIEKDETAEQAAIREVKEETGYKNFSIRSSIFPLFYGDGYKPRKDVNCFDFEHFFFAELENEEQEELHPDDANSHEIIWAEKEEVAKLLTLNHHKQLWDNYHDNAQYYTGEGMLINSGTFDGLTSAEAKIKITEAVGGKMTSTYKIKDWVFSRQRYWGEPIPIIHCEKDGAVAVPEDQLPVMLPEVDSYEPSGTGESPLVTITDWVHTTCPTCGGPAKRETNTMPQWAGSSWYYLRFMDPDNKEALVAKDVEKYWAPVDVYVGGDHAVRHLIYARFWHKFLYDIGSVSTIEPFARLEFLGFILAEDGRKMSKRYGNVINPTDVINTYGADAFRTYEMFMGPFENTVAWSTASIAGTARFIERVWKVESGMEPAQALTPLLHQTIKKVTEDIEAFKFNTAISQMMIFLNAIEKEGAVGKEQWESFLRILAPFAPHVTDELWERLGATESIHTAVWPTYDPAKTVADTVTVAIQINGKTRATIELASGAGEEEALAAARSSAEIAPKLIGSKELRAIYVPGKIINFVVELA